MKKIEKDLILKDLDYINNECDIKLQKLNSIISLFLDEEPVIAKKATDEKFKQKEKEAQNIQDKEDEKESETDSDEEQLEEIVEDDKITESLPPDIKTLYRKIVMMTNPDKNKNNNNLDFYQDLYKKTIKAKDDNDKAEIIYIAYKLKLSDVYELDDEHFGSIKRKIKEKELSSNSINTNSFWVWYHTDSQSLKRIMAAQIAQMSKRK